MVANLVALRVANLDGLLDSLKVLWVALMVALMVDLDYLLVALKVVLLVALKGVLLVALKVAKLVYF
jgi:hypothetical protein